jgi:hypothetical protein
VRLARPALTPGVLVTSIVLAVFLGIAASVDFPRASLGFKGDEATYYVMTHSLARDGDATYQRQDLLRVWEEYSAPEGIFLKKGARVDDVQFQLAPPFVVLEKSPDPARGRLYFGKAYIYPLFAAPFVRVFGTSGFLVFHALLLALNVGAATLFLRARGSPPGWAAGFAAIFIFASVTPVYFVWLTPELFNFTLVLQAYFLWAYKHAAPAPAPSPDGPDQGAAPVERRGLERVLHSPATDYVAAVLLGIATFSKPTHILLILPLLAFLLWTREWRRLVGAGALFAAVVAGLFAGNAAISGEFNYQGAAYGRKSFYSGTGFPFANTWETFDNRGADVATDAVPTDILFHRDTATVLAWNLLYFAVGRHSGLVPYFFPGIVAAALFLTARRQRRLWQWLVFAALAGGALALVSYMPYTYSGGGGPVGNRYFLSFYPLFLFLMPAVRGNRAPMAAVAIGALFTAKLLFNPLYASFHPGEHVKAGPLRMLPIELTLLNDLPVSADAERARRPLAGVPPLHGYFPDNGAYPPEGDTFWVRGRSRADVILRAPAWMAPDGRPVPLRIRSLTLEITNGLPPNRVTVSSGFHRETIDLASGEVRTIEIAPAPGVPYKPARFPTNFVYPLSIATTAGFAPFLEDPGGSQDSRYLGVRVRIVPVYYNP